VKVEHNPLTEEELAGLLPPNTIISFPPNISEFHIQFEEKISLNPLNIQKLENEKMKGFKLQILKEDAAVVEL